MTIKVSQAVRELYISVLGVPGMEKAMVRQGSYDNTTVMQMLARFEAETVERCAVVAEKAGESYGMDETGWTDCTETVALSIRNLTTGY